METIDDLEREYREKWENHFKIKANDFSIVEIPVNQIVKKRLDNIRFFAQQIKEIKDNKIERRLLLDHLIELSIKDYKEKLKMYKCFIPSNLVLTDKEIMEIIEK